MKSYNQINLDDDALSWEIMKKSEVFWSYDQKPVMMSPSNFGSESVPLDGLWSQYSEPFKSKASSSSN